MYYSKLIYVEMLPKIHGVFKVVALTLEKPFEWFSAHPGLIFNFLRYSYTFVQIDYYHECEMQCILVVTVEAPV